MLEIAVIKRVLELEFLPSPQVGGYFEALIGGSGPDGLSLLPEVDVFGAPLVAEVEEDAPALVKKLGKNNRKGFNPFGFKLKHLPSNLAYLVPSTILLETNLAYMVAQFSYTQVSLPCCNL